MMSKKGILADLTNRWGDSRASNKNRKTPLTGAFKHYLDMKAFATS